MARRVPRFDGDGNILVTGVESLPNPATSIKVCRFTTAQGPAQPAERVRLVVHDVQRRQVATEVNEAPGSHTKTRKLILNR